MANSPNLELPFLTASQSQKHVAVNEGWRIFDAVVQLAVLDQGLNTPPGSPSDGDRYIVASGGTGAWSSADAKVAVYQDGAWNIITPKEGWIAWVADEDLLFIYNGTAWVDFSAAGGFVAASELTDGSITQLGINATPDATNRLSINSAAALFNHDGDDMRLKINKNAVGGDASVELQQGFTTQAFFGLLANNDMTIKVGASNTTAIVIDNTDANVELTEHPKFSAYLNYGQNYTAGAWRDLLFNNFRHNDQGDAAIAANVLTFTAPHDGYYQFGLGVTYEDGSTPTKMQIGLRINTTDPTGDRIGTTGAAVFVSGETSVNMTALIRLSKNDTVKPRIQFTTNDGRILADENYFWGCQIA